MSAAVAAEYILRGVRERGTRTWQQAPRCPVLELGEDEPALRIFSEYRIRGVSELAVRGLWLRRVGREAGSSGRLSPAEHVVFDELFDSLLDAVELSTEPRIAAYTTSARRDSPETAGLLVSHFRDLGRSILAQKPRPRLSSANG